MAGALVRHQRLIAIIASSSLLLSAFYAYTRKPVWEGHFQIVLEQENRQGLSRLAQLAAANPVVANMAGFEKNNTNSLKTEVKILESPSVLKPIYDYVIQQRKRSGKKVNGYSFLDWLAEGRATERNISSQYRLSRYRKGFSPACHRKNIRNLSKLLRTRSLQRLNSRS